MPEVVDHRDLLRRWDDLSKGAAWMIEEGDLHNIIDEAVAQIQSLRQGLWDVYGALGFDRDGDKTPRALVHPPIEVLVLDAANEYRTDTENDAALLVAENGELRRMGRHETEARAFLGARAHTISESQYLFSLAKLVRTRELFTKAARSVGVHAARPDDDGKP